MPRTRWIGLPRTAVYGEPELLDSFVDLLFVHSAPRGEDLSVTAIRALFDRTSLRARVTNQPHEHNHGCHAVGATALVASRRLSTGILWTLQTRLRSLGWPMS